jgi:hypothetical protein
MQQSTQGFPAPVAEASPSAAYPMIFEEFRRVMETFEFGVPESIRWPAIKEGLADLPRHTLSYLNSVIKNTVDNDYLVRTVISAICTGVPASTIDDCAYLYANVDREYYSYATYAGWDRNNGFEGLTMATSTLRGCDLTKIDGLDYTYGFVRPMRLQDNDTDSKVLALFNTINALSTLEQEDATKYNLNESAEYLADPALAQLVVDYHARNAELIRIIETRKTLDAGTLRVILENDSMALSSGVL